MNLNELIRDVSDFPKKGIVFKDITTLLKDGPAFAEVINMFKKRYEDKRVDKVAGIESRGFIFGGALANLLNCGFVPVRKPGKLPYDTISEDYSLEYGTNSLEIHTDAVAEGENILIIDDLLATGGTAEAVVKLIKRLKGNIIGVEFLIELDFLNGRKKLEGYPVNSLIKY